MLVAGQITKAGEYDIMATWTPVFKVTDSYWYDEKQQSITSFEVVSDATSEQQTQSEPIPGPTVTQESVQKIPKWVKNIFTWYSQDKISEDEVLNAIKFLVNQGIIDLNE